MILKTKLKIQTNRGQALSNRKVPDSEYNRRDQRGKVKSTKDLHSSKRLGIQQAIKTNGIQDGKTN